MLNVNAFVLLLCLELNSRRIDTAEINNFIVWPNDDIRTVAMSVFGLGVFSTARRHALVPLRHAAPSQRHAALFLFFLFLGLILL